MSGSAADEFDVLPDTTEDERGPGWGDDEYGDDNERLTEERPPHWS